MKLASLALAATLASSGCYGSYSALHVVNRWNGSVTSSRVGNSIIHFALWVVPVYELCIAGDFLVFNNIEFFTGERVFK